MSKPKNAADISHIFDSMERTFYWMRESVQRFQYAVVWGFECGDSWFDLLNTLFSNLQYRTDHAGAPQVRISQVKSKLGTLGVNFIGSGDEYAHGLRHMALAFSTLICEQCRVTCCQLNHTFNRQD